MIQSTILALIIVILLYTSSHAVVPTGTECTQPRIRKAWETYTDTEKKNYMDAVKLAMRKGYQQKFVELHIEWFSEMEAHGTCMFIYWHRMYLLGYENMLRSLDSKFKCITIPVWDHLAATARRSAGTCQYVEGCSPIVRDFGGTSVGLKKSLLLYNITITRPSGGTCVNQGIAAYFCGNNTAGCAGCIVRGPAYKTSYPAEAYFGSIYQQMFTYSDWVRFTKSIELGIHNTMHGAVGGTMSYFQSPVDPIFYSHHAFIDMLQTIYLKCQNNGEILLPPSVKGKDPRFWANCPRRNKGFFTNTSTITMNTRDYNGIWKNVQTSVNNTLYPFFKDLPSRYVDYVDAKDLGVYSYTYELSGALSNFYLNCKKSNTLEAASAPFKLEAQVVNNEEVFPLPLLRDSTKEEWKLRRWTIAISEAAKLSGYTIESARDQMEMILCKHKDECLGKVEDFSTELRTHFGVTAHTRCFQILQALASGDRIIGVPNWRAMTDKFLPCPRRDKEGVEII